MTTSARARERVGAARARAQSRLAATPWRLNSQVPGAWLRGGAARLTAATTRDLDRALERGSLTMRGYDRVLRVAWTLADLDGVDRPTPQHVNHALYLRRSIST